MLCRQVCRLNDIPIGSEIVSDIHSASGALLIKAHTIITPDILSNVSKYAEIVLAIFNTPDALNNTNNILKFSDSFKSDALSSVKSIYNNLQSPDIMFEKAVGFSNAVYSMIETSNDLELNINNLKVSDEYSYKHSVDVSTLASMIAAELDMSEQMIKNIGIAGILHDIGKAKVPNAILNKPDKLTPEEFQVMKAHSIYGYEMLVSSDIDTDIKNGVLNHHENVDGTGYPRCLLNDDIGDIGKVLAIADVFDALATKRPYKPANSAAKSIEIMFTMSNKFDLDYFRAFLSVIDAYSTGSIVKLSNGQSAKVIAQNNSFPLRPIVSIDDAEINLSTDMNYLSVTILDK